ncbi:hypothetical protein LA52FAK_03690 [Desulforhopalus sp. 52FAK]
MKNHVKSSFLAQIYLKYVQRTVELQSTSRRSKAQKYSAGTYLFFINNFKLQYKTDEYNKYPEILVAQAFLRKYCLVGFAPILIT